MLFYSGNTCTLEHNR